MSDERIAEWVSFLGGLCLLGLMIFLESQMGRDLFALAITLVVGGGLLLWLAMAAIVSLLAIIGAILRGR